MLSCTTLINYVIMHAKFAVCVCVRQKFSVCNKILKIKTQPKSSHSPAPFSLIKVSISGRYTHTHTPPTLERQGFLYAKVSPHEFEAFVFTHFKRFYRHFMLAAATRRMRNVASFNDLCARVLCVHKKKCKWDNIMR